MKVDFIILGAQKSGTTTLFDILNTESSIVGCSNKEPNFFSQKNWRKKLKVYEALFKEGGLHYLEASTHYTFKPHIPNKNIVKDLYEYNPNLKFIYIVRKPIDRIVSGYMHGRQTGGVSEDINLAVKNNSFFIDVTRYHYQIKPYIDEFGRDHVLLIDFEDLITKQNHVVANISEFLGVKLDYQKNRGKQTHKNSSIGTIKPHYKYVRFVRFAKKVAEKFPRSTHHYFSKLYQRLSFLTGDDFNKKPELTNETKQFILNELEDEIDKLQLLMNKKLSHWKNID